MGCVTSKPKENCQASFSHMQTETDNIQRTSFSSNTFEKLAQEEDDLEKKSKEIYPMGMIKAKICSKIIEENINKIVPKTPTQTPPGEPETIINTWELMEGLEENGNQGPKPISIENNENNSKSCILEFDHEVISILNNVVRDIPPGDPFQLMEALLKMNLKLDDSDVKKGNGNVVVKYEKVELQVKEKLVLYFTSLRGVRKTYEDCCNVRMILKGLGVHVDERDVSMHSGFKEELNERIDDLNRGGGLPKLFIGTKYIGGVEEIQRMHELGQLEKLIKNCEKMENTEGGSGGDYGSCEACGDVRFVPCYACSGSCKIFDEDCEEDENGFQRCPNCNENGLIRCPFCCD